MKSIQVTARMSIQDGKMDEFKKMANACVKIVKAKDKNTLQYDWFYNESTNECIVHERYTNSDAVLEHVGNVGHLLGGLVELSTLNLEVYGSPSESLKATFAAFGPTYYYYGMGI